MTTNYNQPELETDQNLGETVTKLAAAAPYMAPPADLRGKILQATAPQTFRMEDYRKATQESGRFFRWGFAAACVFLGIGAWYNMALRNQYSAASAQFEAMKQQLITRDKAIANLISPKVDLVAVNQGSKLAAKAYINDANKTAVVVIPKGSLPPDQTINQITLTREGKKVAYTAIPLIAPPEDFPEAVSLVPTMNVQNMEPTPAKPAYKATLSP